MAKPKKYLSEKKFFVGLQSKKQKNRTDILTFFAGGKKMIANIFIVLFIVFWIVFVVHSIIKSKKIEKKSGIPAGCYSCKAFKDGKCKSHCGEN